MNVKSRIDFQLKKLDCVNAAIKLYGEEIVDSFFSCTAEFIEKIKYSPGVTKKVPKEFDPFHLSIECFYLITKYAFFMESKAFVSIWIKTISDHFGFYEEDSRELVSSLLDGNLAKHLKTNSADSSNIDELFLEHILTEILLSQNEAYVAQQLGFSRSFVHYIKSELLLYFKRGQLPDVSDSASDSASFCIEASKPLPKAIEKIKSIMDKEELGLQALFLKQKAMDKRTAWSSDLYNLCLNTAKMIDCTICLKKLRPSDFKGQDDCFAFIKSLNFIYNIESKFFAYSQEIFQAFTTRIKIHMRKLETDELLNFALGYNEIYHHILIKELEGRKAWNKIMHLVTCDRYALSPASFSLAIRALKPIAPDLASAQIEKKLTAASTSLYGRDLKAALNGLQL